jgi:hypothetical protein
MENSHHDDQPGSLAGNAKPINLLQSKPGEIFWRGGVSMNFVATSNIAAIVSLMLLAGRIGQPNFNDSQD